MTTFSQLVDKMVAETKRPDLLIEICSYLNQTLREVHMEPQRGNAVFYRDNMKEVQIQSNVDTGLYWDVPKVSTFQGLRAVRYDNVYTEGRATYADELLPGKAMGRQDAYFYRAGSRVFFSGFGGVNAYVSLCYFEYVPYLDYYTIGLRPAQYTESAGWIYAPSITTPDQQAAAQLATSNWLLLRWSTVIEEGVRAKVYKRLSDDGRARTSFSMYQTQRQGLVTGETADLSGYQ